MGLLLLLYLALSLNYNIASPIFEPPDEATHFRYVKYLLDHKTLPAIIDGPNRDELWGLHQPPLYFMISAIFTAPFDLIAPDDYLERNPHINMGFATKPGNKNLFIHSPAETLPYRGFPLVVRAMRLLSTLFGALTLVVVYRIGLEIFAGRKSLAFAAPALMVLHPEFVFITASIANEPLNILLMALGLWGCVRLILRGPTLRRAIWLGAVAGLILVTKMTGMALILLIVIAMLIAALRGHSAPKLWQTGFVIGGLMALLGSWWYLYNTLLYGDPWQQGMYTEFYNTTQHAISWDDWIGGILRGEVSFWATFGWFNILVPEWIYTFYKILVRLAGLGLLVYALRWALARRRKANPSPWLESPALILLLLASPLVSSLILTRLIATEGGIQGRQLLPMLPALALLVVIGYRSLLPGKVFGAAAVAAGAVMLGITVAIPQGIIAPAYALPAPVIETELPDSMVELHRFYGDAEVELLGYRLEPETVLPGESVSLTLYWRALKPMARDYTVFIHALGRGGEKIGEFNGYPGMGTLATSQWEPGRLVADRYTLVISPPAQTPTVVQLHAGLFDYSQPDAPPLPVVNASGEPVSSQVAQVDLLPSPNVEPIYECALADVTFADNISLTCFDTDSPGQITFFWRATATPSADYTVFIQLWRDGAQVAGFDSPPLQGDFPTSHWRTGLRVVDPHSIDLAQLSPGTYRVWAGLYHPQTGERVPAYFRDAPLLNFAVDLGELVIPPQ